jgi:outer membrane protein assembly factor BamB
MHVMTDVDGSGRRGVTGARRLAGVTLIAGVALVASLPGAAGASTTRGAAPPSVTTTDWTVYHRNLGGTGAGPAGLSLSPLQARWTSKALDGQIYGEPLVFNHHVFVATENDTVYSLDSSSGAVQWSKHLGTPVPSGDLPCGDIKPTVGITSTPVIDAARSEIFVVADELVGSSVHHLIYGLGISTGALEMSQNADPPSSNPPASLQRASLTLDGANVVFGFGGNAGDCSTYHGWIESVPVIGGPASFFEVDSASGESRGAVWMGGAAPVIDHNGDIWFATGNGSVKSASGPYDHSDSVLELSPTLQLLQYFAPINWYQDNSTDADLGSTVPALLPNGFVLQVGKSNTAYLLDANHLGGIGGQVASMPLCTADPFGGVAISGDTVFDPCGNGITAVLTSTTATNKMTVLWTTSTGADGPPITAGGLVWTISAGTLYGLSPTSGHAVEQASIGGTSNHFPTPAVGDGLLLAPSSDQVHAFS